MRNIPFSPPDISEAEIENVSEVLRSGWITTGPKTKLLEQRIAKYCGTNKAVCLNSATACMEMILRLFGIGEGDEVITSAYTYTASASVVCHVGAKLVLVDTAKDSYQMDYDMLADKITEKTKAIIPVDIAGVMCDYDRIFEIVNSKKHLFKANNEYQKALGRILVMADSAHGFGSEYKGKKSGSVSDFTSFSFHAVKNLTTAEGGALTWNPLNGISDDEIYKQFMLLSLHGQSKDALAKTQLGAWEYDIVSPAYKCNMTDIMAAIGHAQLDRYEGMLDKRKQYLEKYEKELTGVGFDVLKHYDDTVQSSGHLCLTRLRGRDSSFRNEFITKMAERGIACNVHYKPIPMHTAYKNLGFDIADFPNAYAQFENEVSLPLNTKMTLDDVCYVIDTIKELMGDN
ncbi:MAG: DegT/DnrJ/EryC1/StrS aminotransferase family protein [Clostridia bacterium]|nr:DegT/DnrJ/EryC1/StrS aminotransferase family protein [Clostridia bacterium]